MKYITLCIGSYLACLLPAMALAAGNPGASPAKEHVPGGTLMLIAYILIWFFPLALLWITHRHLSKVEDDATSLRAMIDKAGAAQR